MRIVFIGTVEFSYKSLEKILSLNGNVVGVCTKENSTFNSDFKDITPLCTQHHVPYKFVEDINSQETLQWIKNLNPDIIFCFGWSSLIKKDLLHLAPMGVIGYHPTKLPQNRGRHPIIWALAQGLTTTGSSFFFMDEGADSGDILSQKDISIQYEDDAKSLYTKVINTALIQIEEFLPQLQNKSFSRQIQNHNNANTWRKRGKKDGLIDFRMSSTTIYNLVRALTKPYVGAHVEYKGKDIQIWKTKEIEYPHNNIEAGKVLAVNDTSIIIKCQENAIEFIEHEFKSLPKIGEYL